MDAMPLKILLVEDNPADVVALQRALVQEIPHASIEHWGSAEDALRLLDSAPATKADILLVDIKLPKMDGVNLLHELRTEAWLRSMATIVWTSSRSASDIARAYDAGADCYVLKPSSMAGYHRVAQFFSCLWRGEDVTGFEDILIPKPVQTQSCA